MTPVTQYYPLYAPDSRACRGLAEALPRTPNAAGAVTWDRVKAYLVANPTRTAAVQTPVGTFVVSFRPASVEAEALVWVENSYLRDAELRPARNVDHNPIVFY